MKKYVDHYIILALYVDDMLIVGANMAKIDRLKKQLSENFDDKDTALGGNVNQTPSKRIVSIMVLDLFPHRLGLWDVVLYFGYIRDPL